MGLVVGFDTGTGTVSVNKNTPPDKKTGWEISFENTKTVAGLQFLLPGRMAKAQARALCLFTDTGIGAGVGVGISRNAHDSESIHNYNLI